MKNRNVFDLDRLFHIKDAIDFIQKHTYGMNEDDFLREEILKRAVVREFEVIGEAANYLSKDIKIAHSKVEWAQIISLRNRLIHEYQDVNYRTVWEIVTDELDNLKLEIEVMIIAVNA